MDGAKRGAQWLAPSCYTSIKTRIETSVFDRAMNSVPFLLLHFHQNKD